MIVVITKVNCLNVTQIWNHPDILYHHLNHTKDEVDLDIDDACIKSVEGVDVGRTKPKNQRHRTKMDISFESGSQDSEFGPGKQRMINYDWVR